MIVGVVGLGLIGGSMARIMKRGGYTLYGTDRNRETLDKALQMGLIDGELTDEKIGTCEVILLCVYPGGTVEWLRTKGPLIERDTVVMDTCGVKRAVCGPAWEIADQYGFTFVGGHPMDGVAKIGLDHSSDTMFKKASMILCPRKDATLGQLHKLKNVLDAAGFGRYEMTTPEHHDEMIALTSQLAHVVSSAYVKAPLSLQHKGYSAGSFRDMTRVSYLNEVMWTELFMDNRENLLHEVEGLMERLALYRDALRDSDWDNMRDLLREGRETKEQMDREDRK